jgi:hypothetical protein
MAIMVGSIGSGTKRHADEGGLGLNAGSGAAADLTFRRREPAQ